MKPILSRNGSYNGLQTNQESNLTKMINNSSAASKSQFNDNKNANQTANQPNQERKLTINKKIIPLKSSRLS